MPCAGSSYGCSYRAKRGALDQHIKTCAFATLAPFLDAQKKQLDDQAAEQAFLRRKVNVLEGGFQSVHALLIPKSDIDHAAADPASIPLLDESASVGHPADVTTASSQELLLHEFEFLSSPTDSNHQQLQSRNFTRPFPHARAQSVATVPVRPRSSTNFSRPSPSQYSTVAMPDLINQVNALLTPSPFPLAANMPGPYASPEHHLLSLHESLREEVRRVADALHELEGRHSMLILNENLRLKEEMAYLGGQMNGVARQVGWLTSARLQEQQGRATAGPSTERGEEAHSEQAVQDAVSNAATAWRGAARMVNAGREGLGMGRRPTDEGRTKL